MAEVTSKSAVWPSPTAPTSDTTGPSIGGWVAEVIVRSFHPQLLIRRMRPPVTLLALVVVATFRRRWAALTRWLPTPLTCTRRKVRRSPPRAEGTDGPASTCSCVAVPKFFVGADAGAAAATGPVRAGVAHRASVAVVAGEAVRRVPAALRAVAAVGGALVAVVAVDRPVNAGSVHARASIPAHVITVVAAVVVAREIVRDVHTALGVVALVGGARVPVVAVELGATDAVA